MKKTDFRFVPEPPYPDINTSVSPRSRLYSLSPIGQGTASAEGLISYIIRLAEAHSVSPRRLIMEEFSRVIPEIVQYRRRGLFFEIHARSINGRHRFSEMFVKTTENLCGISVRNLTLLPLRALLPFNGAGLIAPNPRWCSSCYAEMLESRAEIYQPLAWSFDLYRVCSRHLHTMTERCPFCNRPQHQIPRSPAIGFCCHCGKWLGKRQNTDPRVSTFDLWTASAIEEIITRLPTLGNLARRNRFVSQLEKAITHFSGGSRNRYCTEIGIPGLSFQLILNGDRRPTLPIWLSVSYGAGIGPVRFLEANFKSEMSHSKLQKMAGPLKCRATRHELLPAQHKAIEEELKSVAETKDSRISVAALVRKHQLTRTHFRYLWPELCRQISANFRATKKALAKENLAEKCRLAKETVNTLLKQGVYPNQTVMRVALKKIGISTADPTIRAACKQQIKSRLSPG